MSQLGDRLLTANPAMFVTLARALAQVARDGDRVAIRYEPDDTSFVIGLWDRQFGGEMKCDPFAHGADARTLCETLLLLVENRCHTYEEFLAKRRHAANSG